MARTYQPSLYFQRVPEPKLTMNRAHLDIDVTRRRSVSVDVRQQEVEGEAARLLDPEGNELCLR